MGGVCGCCRGGDDPVARQPPRAEVHTLKDYLEEPQKEEGVGFDGVITLADPHGLPEPAQLPPLAVPIKQMPALLSKDGTMTPSVNGQSGFQTPSILHEPRSISESSTVSRGTATLQRTDSVRRSVLGGVDQRTGERIRLAIQNRTLSLKKNPTRKVRIAGRDMRRLIAGMNACINDIHVLILSGNLLDEAAAWLLGEWLRVNETLRVLEVTFCGLNTRTTAVLMHLICTGPKCAVRTVNLSYNNLDWTCVHTVAKFLAAPTSSVQNLILRCNPITIRGVAELIACPRLQLLDCSNCFLDTKGGIDPLVQALKSTNLSCLKLQGNGLTDTQVATLHSACTANQRLSALANGGLVLHAAPSKHNLAVVPKVPADRGQFAIAFPKNADPLPLDDTAFLGEESEEERDDSDFMEMAVVDPESSAPASAVQCKLGDLLFRATAEDPTQPLRAVCTRVQTLCAALPTVFSPPQGDSAPDGEHLLVAPQPTEGDGLPSLAGARCLWLELPRAAVDIPFDPAALREAFGRQFFALRGPRPLGFRAASGLASASSTCSSASGLFPGAPRQSRPHPVTNVGAFLKKHKLAATADVDTLAASILTCAVPIELVDDIRCLPTDGAGTNEVGDHLLAWLRSLPADTLATIWFVVSFKANAVKVFRELVTIRKAAQALRWSVPLRGVLKTALQMCQALDDLSLLTPDLDAFTRAKSISGEHTLLATLAEHVLDSEQSYLVSFTSTVLPYVSCMPAMLHAGTGFRDLRDGLRRVVQFAAANPGPEYAGLAGKLNEFAAMASATLAQLRGKLQQLVASVEKLAVYFGEDPSTFDPDRLFDILARFCGTFDATVKSLMANRATCANPDDALWSEGYSLAQDSSAALSSGTLGAHAGHEDEALSAVELC